MKQTIFTLLLGFLFFGNIFGQGFQRSAADKLLAEGKLKLAIEEYAKVYKRDSTNNKNVYNTDTYNYACALALDRQIDKAFHYLNISMINDTSVFPLNDPDFYFLIEDERWSELETELFDRAEIKYGKLEETELIKEFLKMELKDQAFYYHIEIEEEKSGPESSILPALWELKERINKENLDRLIEIIDARGWPKKSVVKESAATTAFLIIQHSDLETQKKYLPIMKEAADNGEADWSSLALLIDRVNLGEGKEQIYGSQIYRNKDGSFYVKDLMEPEYVNQRRKEVGLGPIEDYLQHYGIEWKVVQKEK